MKRRTLYSCFLIAVLLFSGCAHNQPAPSAYPAATNSQAQKPEQTAEYRILPGDALEIKFYYNTDLNDRVSVRPDGNISLQLIGDVRAAALTPAELRAVLAEKYKAHVRNPEIAVIVREFAEQKIFVGGEVNIPGMIPLAGKMTSLRAIMQAGGFKNTAEPETVVLIRNQGTDKPLFITLNLKQDLTNTGQNNDIELKPFDIVFVPKSTIASINQFMEQYFDKLIPVSKSIGVFYNLGPERP